MSHLALRSTETMAERLHIVDEVGAVAAGAGATRAQIALAWLLAQGDDIAPIPWHRASRPRGGEHRRGPRAERRADRTTNLNNLTPAAGKRHDEGNMAVIDR